MRNIKRCACGLPLHYTDKAKELEITKDCESLGEWMPYHTINETYLIQRHYHALHGLKGNEIPLLVKQGIVRKERK